MIPSNKLLPTLSAKDREAFNELVALYDSGRAQIDSYTREQRIARKNELRAKLATAQGADLLSVGAELQTLNESFTMARQGAKQQLRDLKPRYVELFEHLIGRSIAHTEKLIEQANAAYRSHFAAFDAEPTGQSPLVDSLVRWKAGLEMKLSGLSFYRDTQAGMPVRPTEILPYSVETKTGDIL